MQEGSWIWHNGKLVPWQDAKIHVLSHTLHYSAGAFEGIRFYDMKDGSSAIFRLEDHIDRLLYSATQIHMKVPYDKETICTAIKELVISNKVRAGYIRPIIYYGYTKMGVSPIGNPVELAIASWPWGAYLPDAVNVKTSSFIRSHRSTNVSAKLCGNYLNGVLASLELQGTQAGEALLLDERGYISEGVGENIFFVKKGELYTPKLGTILPGITRDTIIKLCLMLNLNVKEKNIRLKEAYTADEAFFTGTAAEVSWIHSLDGKPFAQQTIGKITSLLRDAYLDVVNGKNNHFKKFLTYVSHG